MFKRPQVQKIIITCKICFSEQSLGVIADYIPLPLSEWEVLHVFVNKRLFSMPFNAICPLSRITYIEMHMARYVNNQRCDRSQAVAANSKIVLYFQF